MKTKTEKRERAERLRQTRAAMADAPLVRQLHVARQQVDGAPGGPLGWLVGFASEDPEAWLPSDIEGHGLRLLAFTRPLPPNQVAGSGLSALSRREVLALHGEIKEMLRAIVSGPAGLAVVIPTDGLRVAILRLSGPREKPAAYSLSHAGPIRTMLWQRAAQLVFKTDRLVACRGPRCGRPFLALRKMVFCSAKCAQQWHDAAKIAKKKKGEAF